MLTDYHVHLRPDEESATAAEFFTTDNVARYREVANDKGITELGVSEHIHRFVQALDIWQHPFWQANAVDDVDSYCEFVRNETDLKLGIEADFVPGREDQVANFLDAREWDYVIGSVHFLQGRTVDMEKWDIWAELGSPEKVWSKYFETLAHAAMTGIYDIMAHPDLVKIWGTNRPLPEGDLRRYYYPAVEAMHEAGVAIEVSTAGLRKPVGEIYPAPEFLELVVEANIPVALSSDAHRPEHIGFGYEDAIKLLSDFGIGEICVFEKRQRRLEPIG